MFYANIKNKNEKKSITSILLFSCRQSNKEKQYVVEVETSDVVKIAQNKITVNDNNIDTKYEYTDSNSNSVIIQNGLPKGGLKYTDPNGDDYNYAVFWTQITNLTNSPLELNMNIPVASYKVPSLPNKYYKVLISVDTMTVEKIPLFNYGLRNMNSFLDKNSHKSASLRRTINPKKSNGFYVIILCLKNGAKGTIRTGLRLQGQHIFYKIKTDGSKSNSKSSDQEIDCGTINLKNLVLKKIK